jgi:hypothetical protein
MDAESSSRLVALRMPQGYEWHILPFAFHAFGVRA